MSKTLILIRHAHRDTTRRELDNGLTDKGRDQAKMVRRFFMNRFAGEEFKNGLWFVSSPKLRCRETLQPLAKELNRPVDTHPGLDEQSGREGFTAFQSRIQAFLTEWKQSAPSLTVLCSHGDWLPLASQQLLTQPYEFKKGGWLELEWSAAQTALKWYIPTFKPFFQ